MNNKKRYGISVGSSSILIIIVILCLVCFAGLSIVSATADYKLSCRLAERTTGYYKASGLANQKLANLDQAFHSAYLESTSKEDYFQKIKESYADSLTFSYPVSDTQALCVSVKPVYPEEETGNFFEVTDFQIITTKEMELDNSLPVLLSN